MEIRRMMPDKKGLSVNVEVGDKIVNIDSQEMKSYLEGKKLIEDRENEEDE